MSSLLLRSTLIVILIFCNYSPSSDAIRSFPIKEPEKKNLYETHVMLSESNHGFRFSEAPEFRNGANCRGFVSSSSSSSSSWGCDLSESDDHVVHISMTLDFEYLRGSMAAILSLLKHASCPDDIFFHFIAIESEQRNLIQLIRSTFPSLVNFKVYQFTEQVHVKNLISSSIREALENPLNYARNYLADLLEPCVKRVIYLDSDLVVVDDIQKLWNVSLISNGSRSVISAPEYCHTNFTSYFTHGFWSDSEMSSRVFSGRNHQPCYFNTGVMVMDLERWREGDYRRRIEGWMELQKQKRIYQLGSLPPFLLVFAGDIQAIDHRWNQHGLGGDNVMGSCRSLHPGPVSLLHWSGKGKPWLRLDQRNPCPLDHLWEPYDLYLPHPLRSPF